MEACDQKSVNRRCVLELTFRKVDLSSLRLELISSDLEEKSTIDDPS